MIDLRPFSKFNDSDSPLGTKLEKIFGIDLRSLALFRIALALLILADLIHRTQDLVAHYSDQGILPRSSLIDLSSGRYVFLSLHLLSGSPAYQAFLFCLAGLFALALLMGYRTRLAALLSWIFLLSLHERNPFVLNHGDRLLRMLLFWSLFLPLGARFSLDNRLHRLQAKPPKRILTAATLALYGQMALFYWFAGLHKLQWAEWRSEGTAVFYALHMVEFAQPMGIYLLKFPALLKTLTHLVLMYNFVGPALLLAPVLTDFCRLLALSLFWFMHLSFGICLEVGLFSWIASAAMLPFLPSVVWDRAHGRRETPTGNSPAPGQVSPAMNCLAGFFLLYISLWNSADYFNYLSKIPAPLRWVGTKLMIYQSWPMFSPHLSNYTSGWFAVSGTLADGKKVNLALPHSSMDLARPAQNIASYTNFRWKYYLIFMKSKKKNADLWNSFTNYFCRDWKSRHPEDSAGLQEIQVIFKRDVLWRGQCEWE